MVYGPTSSTILLIKRVLAKVPSILFGTSCHYFVVSSSGSIGVEVLWFNPQLHQILGSRRFFSNVSSR